MYAVLQWGRGGYEVLYGPFDTYKFAQDFMATKETAYIKILSLEEPEYNEGIDDDDTR